MHSLGNPSKTTFLHVESGKTFLEFEAAAAIKRGQPLKLDATGKATPWAKADLEHTLIGYAYNDAAVGEFVTAFVRGYAVIYALSAAALNCGPVAYNSYDAATVVGGVSGYNKYDDNQVGATEVNGWALDAAAAADVLIRVLLKN